MNKAGTVEKAADSAQAPRKPDYHIEATESLVERTLRTLKHNDLFAVFDQQGNFAGGALGPDGLFYKDTRFLSEFRVRLGGAEPLQLGSVLLDDNGAMVVDLTNADLHTDKGRIWLQRESVHLSRFKFLNDSDSFERIRLRSYGPIGQPIVVDISFDADFADLFEVRGAHRARRGTRTISRISESRIEYRYVGLDNVARTTVLAFEPAPTKLTEGGARWDVDLDAASEQAIIIKVCCLIEDQKEVASSIADAFRTTHKVRRMLSRKRAHLDSSNSQFDAVIARAWSDLDMLMTETEWGPYPYAGVPWYSTIFGRDGIITAMMLMWCAPYMARGVLLALASLQATTLEPLDDAEPGKILHEKRGGEMAGLGEVPFGKYYGSVDATPLFIMLAAQYFDRTADLDTIRAIWPNILAALQWIETYGDIDDDGFVEYARMSDKGLSNQGWKDSVDSVFHADGRLAQAPIALCEVQGYVFAAKQGAAVLAAKLGDSELAARLAQQAEDLRVKFEADFWIEELGTYAIALDGDKRPCRVLASNAGHCLFTGIASPERAKKVAELLVGKRFHSGWGVRTVAVGEARYNPMSYHNGSIWPHDNGLIAMGLARYGFKKAALSIFEGIFDSALYDDLRRLPELFCGFERRRRQGPTSYPVACSPQAWAAATPFALVAASIGCQIDPNGSTLRLLNPALPKFLDDLTIRNIEIGESRVDLKMSRVDGDVTTAVLRRTGDVVVTITK
jgi:glycogen debranching enzyme